MHSDFLLIDSDASESEAQLVERLSFGDTSGRNEAWLRDTLLAHPELLPLQQIDPAYGPLIPLCRELRTQAGPIDVTFINPQGRLTLVECKLWRNPEARRKVVAQILDYARVVSRWSYSDLQRSVAMATGQQGNVPFELVRRFRGDIAEHEFVDQTAGALRQGRFLLVIAGDGIRDDVGAMAELITRNSSLAFSFGLVEMALYGMADGRLLVQPRVTSRTEVIERTVVVVRGAEAVLDIADTEETSAQLETVNEAPNTLGESTKQAEYRRWWQPVMDMTLDDPDQEPPKLFWPNNVRLPLPWKDTWIVAYAYGGESGFIGVGTSGRGSAAQELMRQLEPQTAEILAELPPGTEFRQSLGASGKTIACKRRFSDFKTDDERRSWLADTINSFVNSLRPRVKQLAKSHD